MAPRWTIPLLGTIPLLAFAALAGPGEAARPAGTDRLVANRLTFGLSPAMAADADVGSPRWIEAQLRSDDARLPAAAEAQVDRLTISRSSLADLVIQQDAVAKAANAQADPAIRQAGRDAYQKAMQLLADEARTRFVLRALYAPDQLREQLGWFWFNHFNVQANKRDIRAMLGDYEDRLRAAAFGRFRDLLELTLRHPAMLRYLDNDQNAVGHINENYARELMELHSMGVGSGYSQQDVQELARILTGLTIRLDPGDPRLKPEWQRLYVRDGLFVFNPARHDFGTKHFLGHEIQGRGYAEIAQALDLIAESPATARHVSTRLATYFVGDDPPPALVDRLAATFRRSHGDMAAVMRTLCRSPEFAASLGQAFKDPVHYALSAVRFAYGDRVILNPRPVIDWIARMGEPLYAHETPDGYPLGAAAWSGPGQMATRFDVARAIGGGSAGLFRAPGTAEDQPAFPQLQNALYWGGVADGLGAQTRAALAQAKSPQEWNALFLSSPDFMRR